MVSSDYSDDGGSYFATTEVYPEMEVVVSGSCFDLTKDVEITICGKHWFWVEDMIQEYVDSIYINEDCTAFWAYVLLPDSKWFVDHFGMEWVFGVKAEVDGVIQASWPIVLPRY